MHNRNLTRLLSNFFQINPFKRIYEQELLERFRVSLTELTNSLAVLLISGYITEDTSRCYICRSY